MVTTKRIKEELKTIPIYYGKVQCSQDNPMISLKDLNELLNKLETQIDNPPSLP